MIGMCGLLRWLRQLVDRDADKLVAEPSQRQRVRDKKEIQRKR